MVLHPSSVLGTARRRTQRIKIIRGVWIQPGVQRRLQNASVQEFPIN
jgi:hypothetical protein